MRRKKKKIFIYVSGLGNEVSVVQVDEQGNHIKTLQTTNKIVDPLPPRCEKLKAGPHLATESITKHPKYNLLYTLTSFWSNHQAILTTFRIDKNTGELTKLLHVVLRVASKLVMVYLVPMVQRIQVVIIMMVVLHSLMPARMRVLHNT